VRRLKAIFIDSVGNLVEWYDFYARAAFALYFAVLSSHRSGCAAQLDAAVIFAGGS
jgi:MFS transporter, MHS family, alpha-ketoglutarate permease